MADSTQRSRGTGTEDERSVWKAGGLGLELTGSIVGMAAVGWGIDRWAETSPRWLLILLGVGILGGGYNFIRHALALSRESSEAYRRKRAASGASEAREPRAGAGQAGMFERKAGTWDDDEPESGGTDGGDADSECR